MDGEEKETAFQYSTGDPRHHLSTQTRIYYKFIHIIPFVKPCYWAPLIYITCHITQISGDAWTHNYEVRVM